MKKIEFEEIQREIDKCIFSKKLKKRIKHGCKIVDLLNNAFEQVMKAQDSIIDRLASAGETIREQDEWIECLYTALGENKNRTIAKANSIKELLKNKRSKK